MEMHTLVNLEKGHLKCVACSQGERDIGVFVFVFCLKFAWQTANSIALAY